MACPACPTTLGHSLHPCPTTPPGSPLPSRWRSETACSHLRHPSSRAGIQEASLKPPLGLKLLPSPCHYHLFLFRPHLEGWSQPPSVGQSARSELRRGVRGPVGLGSRGTESRELEPLHPLSPMQGPCCWVEVPLPCEGRGGPGGRPQKLRLSPLAHPAARAGPPARPNPIGEGPAGTGA